MRLSKAPEVFSVSTQNTKQNKKRTSGYIAVLSPGGNGMKGLPWTPTCEYHLGNSPDSGFVILKASLRVGTCRHSPQVTGKPTGKGELITECSGHPLTRPKQTHPISTRTPERHLSAIEGQARIGGEIVPAKSPQFLEVTISFCYSGIK